VKRALILLNPHRNSMANGRWHGEVVEVCRARGWQVTAVTNHLAEALRLAAEGHTDAVVTTMWEFPEYARAALARAGVTLVELKDGPE